MAAPMHPAISASSLRNVRRLVLAGCLGLGGAAALHATAHAAAAPVVEAASYLGGSANEQAWVVTTDPAGDIFISGNTQSTDFTTTPGTYQTTAPGGGQDAFVTRLTPDGQHIVYSTYLGGSGWDGGFGITADATGDAYVTGVTCSSDFPTTTGAYQATSPGAGCHVFVSELDPTGAHLLHSTYFGGKTTLALRGGDDDQGQAIALGPGGLIYVAGETNSIDLPITTGAVQPLPGGDFDGFVAVFSADAGSLLHSTYLGGLTYDYLSGIAVDGQGNAYATGQTQSANFPTTMGAFQTSQRAAGTAVTISKLDPTLHTLLYSTYCGGSTGGSASTGANYAAPNAMVLDTAGDVYFGGEASTTDYPTTTGALQRSNAGQSDGFVTELNPQGSALVFSTYFGGSDYDGIFGLALGAGGDVYISGYTASADLPVPNAFQPKPGGGGQDGFLARLDPTGSQLVWSSYLGGSDRDDGYTVAVSGSRVITTGFTYSLDFPVRNAFQPHIAGTPQPPGAWNQTFDAYVAVIDDGPAASVPEAPLTPLLLLLPAVLAVALPSATRWRWPAAR